MWQTNPKRPVRMLLICHWEVQEHDKVQVVASLLKFAIYLPNGEKMQQSGVWIPVLRGSARRHCLHLALGRPLPLIVVLILSLLLEESEPHVKQICTDPDTFGTTTIMIFPFFEFVKQIFTDQILLGPQPFLHTKVHSLNYTCTLALSGRGTCLRVNGVNRAYDFNFVWFPQSCKQLWVLIWNVLLNSKPIILEALDNTT